MKSGERGSQSQKSLPRPKKNLISSVMIPKAIAHDNTLLLFTLKTFYDFKLSKTTILEHLDYIVIAHT